MKEFQDTMKMYVVDMENAENGIHTHQVHQDLLEAMTMTMDTVMDTVTE